MSSHRYSAVERFTNREEAGRALAGRLAYLADRHPIVLGLPRGGVPVAAIVAEALHVPLDVIVVRKLGVPYQPEIGMGAVGEEGARVLHPDTIAHAGVSAAELARVEARERAEVDKRAERFRRGRPPLPLEGRAVIIVDDGIATGGTAEAAVRVARARGAQGIIVAVPVAAPEAVRHLCGVADEVVALEQPTPMWAVGAWYRDFHPVDDDDVVALLDAARRPWEPEALSRTSGPPFDEDVAIRLHDVTLPGRLTVPGEAAALIVFSHGSGSSRHSPRNRSVARSLNRAGLATLLFDLLPAEDGLNRHAVFDIELLAGRLVAVTGWVRRHPAALGLPVGYFGASTGAAAALAAAATPDVDVFAIVSRGGRVDLVWQRLPHVHAPTLLIVGSRDDVVLDLTRDVASRLGGPHELDVVTGASHLFDEPRALEAVTSAAARWFRSHLPAWSETTAVAAR